MPSIESRSDGVKQDGRFPDKHFGRPSKMSAANHSVSVGADFVTGADKGCVVILSATRAGDQMR